MRGITNDQQTVAPLNPRMPAHETATETPWPRRISGRAAGQHRTRAPTTHSRRARAQASAHVFSTRAGGTFSPKKTTCG
jgi:hypothetical protein